MNSNLFNFEQLSSKQVKNRISNLHPNDKNLEIKFICLKKISQVAQRNGVMTTRFLVADFSGSIYCDFIGEFGEFLEEADVIYATDFVANVYKGKLILYQAKLSKAFILAKYFLEFQEFPNLSEIVYQEVEIVE